MIDPPAFPRPTLPAPPSTKPLWKKKRFFIPTAATACLLAIGLVAPAPQDQADAVTATTATAAQTAAALDTTTSAVASTTSAPPTTVAPTTAAPTTAPTTATAAPTTTVGVPVPPVVGTAVLVTHVVDGDTVDISTGERVRLLGYDTPERGECGYSDATNALSFVLLGGEVTMTSDTGDDTDRYGRILRHILVNGTPVGLTMIETGNANARYDSLDGYPRHRYQDEYRAADGPNTFTCSAPSPTAAPAPAPPVVAAPPVVGSNNGPFANCDAVRAAGRAPILAGEPGFESKFDRDGDGVGCE